VTCVRVWRSAWRLSCCSFLCDITGMYNEHPIHPSTPLSSKKTPTSNTTMHEPGLPFHTSERNYRGVSGAGGRGRPGDGESGGSEGADCLGPSPVEVMLG